MTGPAAPTVLTRSLRWNLLVNLAGTGWGAVVQLACIPAYLALLGTESYGLIAFATTLQLTLKAFDFGLSHSINRELAARSAAGAASGSRELVRTLEVVYVLFGIVLGSAIALAAPVLAVHWFGASTLPVAAITLVLRLIGLLVAVQWPLTLFQGALLGLGRAPIMNAAAIVAATLAGGGAVALLLAGHRSLVVFFAWQVLVAAAHTVTTWLLVHRSLTEEKAESRVRFGVLHELRASLTGAGALTLSFLLLTQGDKLLASRWLPLGDYAHYMLGAAIASGLAVLGAPIFNTLLPRLAALTRAGDDAALRRELSRGSRLIAVIVFPCMLALAAMSPDVLWLWTRNAETARLASSVTSALLLGTGLATVLQLLMALQMATGRTMTGTRIHLALLLALVPIGAVAASQGARGVGAAWAVLILVGVLAGAAFVYRAQVRAGAAQWLLRDLGLPLIAMLVVAVLLRPLLVVPLAGAGAALRIVGLLAALALTSALACGLRPAQLKGMLRPTVRVS